MNTRRERLLVLGNGPSLREEYFPLFRGTPCLGMNAAYRYWDRIGWYPDFYCCLDDQVVVSHADEIRRLIEEGRCGRFLLHHNFFKAHADLLDNDRVLALVQLMPGEFGRQKCELLNIPHTPSRLFASTDARKLTTGSYAVRFGAYLGFRSIGLLGIDCRYVERLPQSRDVGGIALEMTSTPERNPNYFFADYQATGDRYNVPNPEAHGGNLHLQSFETLRRDVEANSLEVSPFVCTRDSELHAKGVFPHVPLRAFLHGTYLSAIFMPVTAAELDRLLERFGQWGRPDSRPVEQEGGVPAVELCICFNGARDSAVEAKVREAFEASGLARFFRALRFYYSNLAGLRDLYSPDRTGRHGPDGFNAGPNNQFLDIVRSFARGMARIMLMETDVVALQPGWLSRLEVAAGDREPYWICGSQYRGAGEVRSFWHVNGNAIYSAGDPNFLDFFETILLPYYRERVREKPGLAYDTVFHDFLRGLFSGDAKSADLKRWGQLAHRVRFAEFIVDVSNAYDRLPANLYSLAGARQMFPDSVLFHGAVALMDDQIRREEQVRAGALELVYIDCDAKDEWGHFMAYARNVAAEADALGAGVSFLSSKAIESRSMDSESLSLTPTFSSPSYMRGSPQIRGFAAELRKAIKGIRKKRPHKKLLVYQYTAGLEHLEQVEALLREEPELFATVNIFYAFSVDDWAPEVRDRWRALLSRCVESLRLTVTVPTAAAQRDFAAAFNVDLPVAPHPSTTFDDKAAATLAASSPHEPDSARPCILFPGGIDEAKGFRLVAAAIALLDAKKAYDCVYRAVWRPNTDETLRPVLDSVVGLGARRVEGVLKADEYVSFLQRGDVFVLPYLPPDFARRTSGMVTDAVLLGRPFVAIEGTWLGEVAVQTGAGVAVGRSAGEIVAGIDRVLSDYTQYSEQAARARREYLEWNSWHSLLRTVIYGESEYRTRAAAHADDPFGGLTGAALEAAGGPGAAANTAVAESEREASNYQDLFRASMAPDAAASGALADEISAQLGVIAARVSQLERASEGDTASPGGASAGERGSYGRYLDPELVSRNFSLIIYLENILRNRPMLLRVLNSMHRFFSRLLKLP